MIPKLRTFIDGQFHYWGMVEPDCFKGPVSSSGESLSMKEMAERTTASTDHKDKNKRDIYEGDWVLVYRRNDTSMKGIVYLSITGAWRIQDNRYNVALFDMAEVDQRSIEVIGNKWGNPELLEA